MNRLTTMGLRAVMKEIGKDIQGDEVSKGTGDLSLPNSHGFRNLKTGQKDEQELQDKLEG